MAARENSEALGVIFIGIGANLPSERFGPPRATCEAALRAIEEQGIVVAQRSRWFRSAPVPPSDQPWYVNGAARVEAALEPLALLGVLHDIEADFGRVRAERNAPRILDLDLLAYGEQVRDGTDGLILPHPRMHQRAFVLLPLADIAAGWRHPVLGRGIGDFLADIPPDQGIEPVK